MEVSSEGLSLLGRLFWEKGLHLYAVGGFVRNALLSLPASDIDICSRAMPREVADICRSAASVTPVNPRLGTVSIDVDGETFEHTTFRTESYGTGRDPVAVSLPASMRDDAFRRDFTVNALYLDTVTGELLDPTQKGLQDIRARRLATTADDPSAIMRDDGLRLLRLARFAGELDLLPTWELISAARENCSLIDTISPARIFGELGRLFLSDSPYCAEEGHVRSLHLLLRCGIWERLFGSPPSPSALALYACSPPELPLRTAALFFGRGAGEISSALVKNGFPKYVWKPVVQLCIALSSLEDGAHPTDVALALGREHFSLLYRLCSSADRIFDSPAVRAVCTEWRRAEQNGAPLALSELAVGGRDMLALGVDGRCVGDMLRRLLSLAAENPSLNTRDRLLSAAADILGLAKGR